MKVNLIPAGWSQRPNSVKALMAALKDGMEFQVADVSSRWNGAATTLKELHEQGVTSAQIRYGKRLEKVWFGQLPKV